MRKTFTLALLTMPLLLSGCFVFYGGGWFWSELDSTKRVNVGVDGTCTQSGEDALIDLELTFHDRGYPAESVYNQKRSMKRSMVIMARNAESMVYQDTACGTLSGIEQDSGAFEGQQQFTYCPQGVQTGDDCGLGTVTVGDFGAGGPDKGDYLELALSGGWYDGYEFAGSLQGGNFTVQYTVD